MTDEAGVVPQARGLLRLDALYEVMLAAFLAAAAAARPEDGFALPGVLTPPVLLAGASLLLLAAGAALVAGLAAIDLGLLAAFQARAVLLRRARGAGGRERSPGGRRGPR